jgi:hypothetical protein
MKLKLSKKLLKEMVSEAFKNTDFPSMTDKRSRAQMRADADVHIPDALAGEPEVATSLAQAMGSEEPDAAERLEGGVVEVDVQKMTDKYPKIKAAFQYLRDQDTEEASMLGWNELKRFLIDGEYTIDLQDSPIPYYVKRVMRALFDAIEHAGWEKGVDYEEEGDISPHGPARYQISETPILLRHNFTRYKNLLPKITKAGDNRAYNWFYPRLEEGRTTRTKMKFTKKYFEQIVKEELRIVLEENRF